jgi:dipeptidyl aminopeptidase/acylaminoacyl peptidase
MKQNLTRGEKWLFASPLICLGFVGVAWLRQGVEPESLIVEGATTISSLEFSPDGRGLLVTFYKGAKAFNTGRIYDVESRSKICDLQEPPQLTNEPTNSPNDTPYGYFSWSSDGKNLVAHNYRKVAIWNTRTGLVQANYSYPSTTKYPRSLELRFSPDGKSLIGEGVPPAVYEMNTGRRLNRPNGAIMNEAQIELSENGQLLASFYVEKFRFVVMDTKTKRILWEPTLYGEFSFIWSGDLLFVHDSMNLTGEPRRLLVWNGRTRQKMPSPPPPLGADNHDATGGWRLNPRNKTIAYYQSFTPYNKPNVAVAYKSELIVWDFGASQVLWRRKFDYSLSNLLWSPDGSLFSVVLKTPSQEERIQVFDKTGKLVYEHKNVTRASWSPDSREMAVVINKKPFWTRNSVNYIEIHRVVK